MTLFTIDIETTGGTTVDETILEGVADSLENNPQTTDPAVSINTRTGVVAATFQVEAETLQDAVAAAVEQFGRALVEAGLFAPGKGEAEGILAAFEEVGSLTIAPARNGDPRPREYVFSDAG